MDLTYFCIDHKQTSEEYNQVMRCVESPYYHPATPNFNARVLNMTYFDGSQYSKKNLPEEMDWRTNGAVTDVKDQVCMHFSDYACVTVYMLYTASQTVWSKSMYNQTIWFSFT